MAGGSKRDGGETPRSRHEVRDRDLGTALRKRLVGELAERRDRLREALDRHDLPALGDEAHRLAGAAGYCGEAALCDAARALERLTESARPAARELRRAWHEVDRRVGELLAG